MEALSQRPLLTLGFGAFLCGVALFYLVIQRTRKKRLRDQIDRRV